VALLCPVRPATVCDLDQLGMELAQAREDLKQAAAMLAETERELREARELIDKIQPANGHPRVGAELTDSDSSKLPLQESEAAFSVLANQVPQLVWTCSPDGLAFFFNERWVEYTGLTREHGTKWVAPVHPQEQSQAWDAWMHSIKTGEHFRFENQLRRADGTYRWFLVQAEPLTNADGVVTRWFGTCTDIEDLKRAEQEQRSQQEQLRAFATGIRRAREEERASVARDLHDRVGQLFTGIRMDVSWVERHLPAEESEIRRRLTGTVDLINQGVKAVRRICSGLRPPMLDDAGLEAAIEWEMKEFAARTGIRCRIASSGGKFPVDRDCATAVFRIFQESMTNIARHAEAKSVEIALRQEQSTLMLSVKDDGKGFQVREWSGSMGLLGMKERAEGWGGTTEFISSPGAGTTVVVRVPLLPAAKDGRVG
jgi:PAS domain S-box-containing protein